MDLNLQSSSFKSYSFFKNYLLTSFHISNHQNFLSYTSLFPKSIQLYSISIKKVYNNSFRGICLHIGLAELKQASSIGKDV